MEQLLDISLDVLEYMLDVANDRRDYSFSFPKIGSLEISNFDDCEMLKVIQDIKLKIQTEDGGWTKKNTCLNTNTYSKNLIGFLMKGQSGSEEPQK